MSDLLSYAGSDESLIVLGSATVNDSKAGNSLGSLDPQDQGPPEPSSRGLKLDLDIEGSNDNNTGNESGNSETLQTSDHFQGSEVIAEALGSATLDILKGQISQLNDLVQRQEDTLKNFQDAVEGNKARNQSILDFMSEVEAEKRKFKSFCRRSPDTSWISPHRDYSEPLSSLMSLEDVGLLGESSPELRWKGALKGLSPIVLMENRYHKARIRRENSLIEKALCCSHILGLRI